MKKLDDSEPSSHSDHLPRLVPADAETLRQHFTDSRTVSRVLLRPHPGLGRRNTVAYIMGDKVNNIDFVLDCRDEVHQAHRALFEDVKETATVPPPRPSVQRLRDMADYLPLNLRKTIKAHVGDANDEIKRLHNEGKYFAARWNKCLAIAEVIGMIFKAPVDWAWAAICAAAAAAFTFR